MGEKVKGYEGDGITVWYEVRRCIHAEECVHGLPRVFDPKRRPWIDPSQANSEEITEVVLRCPTGALHVTHADGEQEKPAAENRLTVAPDGPLYLRGDIEITGPDGTLMLRDTRVALCRCGASANKPFCDGSHRDTGFSDAGVLGAKRPEHAEDTTGVLRVLPSENGPFRLHGPFVLVGSDGRSITGTKALLCRCGASQNKPYCDGSHSRVEFEA